MRARTVKTVLAALCALAISACCKDDCDNETTTTTTSLSGIGPAIASFGAAPVTGSIPFRVNAACEAEATNGGSLTYEYSLVCRRDGEVVASQLLCNGTAADSAFVLATEGDCELTVHVCESGGGCADDALTVSGQADDLESCYFTPGSDIEKTIYAVIGYTWSAFGLQDDTSVTIDYAGFVETRVVSPPSFCPCGFPLGFVIRYAKQASLSDFFILKTEGSISKDAYEGEAPDEARQCGYKVVDW